MSTIEPISKAPVDDLPQDYRPSQVSSSYTRFINDADVMADGEIIEVGRMLEGRDSRPDVGGQLLPFHHNIMYMFLSNYSCMSSLPSRSCLRPETSR